MMATPSGRGVQETTCLCLDLLNGWLFGVDVNRIKDSETRARVITYQRECYRVLAAHFMGRAPESAGPIETADPGQRLPLSEINTKLRMIETYGKHLGVRAWRELWLELGLPTTAAFHSHGAPAGPRDPDLNFGDAFAAILSAEIPAGGAGAARETGGQVINAYMNDALTREQANRTLSRLGLKLKHRREDPNEPEFARLYMPNHAPWLNAALRGTAYATGERRAASLLTDKTLAARDKQGGVRGVSIALAAALAAQD